MPASFVFFRLLSSEEAEWLSPSGNVQRGALSELAEAATGSRQILIASGEAIILHPADLPSRKRATWSRAIPYALEDQLIEDIEALHFTLGNTPDAGRLPVAIVSHAQLRTWLETCHQHGVIPTAVIPDILLLPWQEGDWSLLLENQRAVVRISRWHGFATERDTLGLLLDRALLEAGTNKPNRLRLWGPTAAGFSEPATAEIEHHFETAPVEPLALLASAYPGATLNLLQGAYAQQAHWDRWLRPWRVAAVLAGLCLLVQGVTTLYQHQLMQQEVVALSAEMERIYKEAVPGATRIVNPKVQLETRLRELRPNGAAGGAFLELLHQGTRPLLQSQDIILRGFNYRDGQLDLSLQGGNPAALDQLRQQLNQQPGLQAEIRTTQREGQVESRVTLRKAAS